MASDGGGSAKPPVTMIGTVLLPSNYPNEQQIEGLYDQTLSNGEKQHLLGTDTSDPSIRYRALYLACENSPDICGKTLTNALQQAGSTGTAGAGNGIDPRTVSQDASKQLMRNSASISAATGGLSALVRALGAAAGSKTVAVAGGTRTLSGWKGETPEGFSRVSTQDVLDLQEDMGFPIRRAGAFDRGVPGQYYASHAERQAALLEPNTPIEVSSEMCDNCQAFFQRLAEYTDTVQQVTDPIATRYFYPEPVEESRP
jgi:hypothetical protein